MILPAVIRRPLPYRSAFWIPLLVLHVGLVVRILLGHGIPALALWHVGGLLTVTALLLLPIVLVTATVRDHSSTTAKAPR